jgi:hypothetical protein
VSWVSIRRPRQQVSKGGSVKEYVNCVSIPKYGLDCQSRRSKSCVVNNGRLSTEVLRDFSQQRDHGLAELSFRLCMSTHRTVVSSILKIKMRHYSCQGGSFTYNSKFRRFVYGFTNTLSSITLVNVSSINLVFIFRCSCPPHNTTYVRRVDLSALAFNLSLHRHSCTSLLFRTITFVCE